MLAANERDALQHQLDGRVRKLAGRGEVDVVMTVDGKAANTVRIAIR